MRFRDEISYPYQNVRLRTVSNDRAFARVVLCAELRPSPDKDWTDYEGTYDLSYVNGRWTVSRSPMGSLDNGFYPVSAQATQQAFDAARLAEDQAAVRA
jgi:hypothetical protein